MNSIAVRNIAVDLPSEWSELTARNLYWLAKRFPYAPTNAFTLSFFVHALNFPRNIRLSLAFARNIMRSKSLDRQWKNDAYIEFGETHFFEQQILQAVESLDNFKWVHEIGNMDKCLVESFRVGLTRYYGPGNLLANVTAEEFSNADDFLNLFLEKKEEKYLDYLIAVLWRPRSRHPKIEDKRVEFSEFEVIKRAEKLRRMPFYLKNACLINYIGLRNYFMSRESSRIVYNKSYSSSSETSNFGTILLRLAENQTFGIHREVKKTFIHDIVDHLADLKKREKK